MKTQEQIDAKRAYQAKWRASHTEERARTNKEWRATNAEELKRKKVAYSAVNAEHIRAYKAAKYQENIEAERSKRAEYRATNAEKLKAQDKASYARNRGVALAQAARYRENNKDSITASRERNKAQSQAYTVRYRAENVDALKARSRDWHNANPETRLAANARRRAHKINAEPKWDLELTSFAAKEAAHLAKLRYAATGVRWHVDHVVPLKGRTVSGLHVWNNFAVIPAAVNSRKSNSFEVK